MNLGDIYYILFRRKWVILVCSLLGFIAAGAAYFLLPRSYESVAALYISFDVADTPAPDSSGQEVRQVSPMTVDRAAAIMNSEIQILMSYDVTKAVAEAVGPARILPDTNEVSVGSAAAMIERNLVIGDPKAFKLLKRGQLPATPPATQIIRLSFSHPNPAIVQPVLASVITNYIVLHANIHHRTGVFDDYLREKDTEQGELLRQTDDQLAIAKSQSDVVDVAETTRAFTLKEAQVNQDYYVTLADLRESMAKTNLLKSLIPVHSATNTTNAGAAPQNTPTPAELDLYRAASQRVQDLQLIEAKLESQYTTNNPQVQTNQIELAAARAAKRGLEDANPGLVVWEAQQAGTKAPGSTPYTLALDPETAYNNELVHLAGLQARLGVESKELEVMSARSTNLIRAAVEISKLERNALMQGQKLTNIETAMQSQLIASELGPNKVSNIGIAEQPTPPALDTDMLLKIVKGLAAGGVFAGLALAFGLEMVLDRSFKRPQDVVNRLNLPFFLSVPYLNGNARLRLSNGGKEVKLLPSSPEAPGPAAEPKTNALAPALDGPVTSWDDTRGLRPFHETLRDRLVNYFEIQNLTHKPKLVAVTSCDTGAGVSTIASGLASSLSETGDGNVLLVNMNTEDGAAQHFYKGMPALGLDDALEKERRDSALVRDNLYVVKESSDRDKLPAILPKRFSHLVSRMKASDYDYIIFDMPPVTHISITPRLSRFMDIVLLVVESEKTDRDVAQRATALLNEYRANVGVVMNKTRSYVPRRLHQEL